MMKSNLLNSLILAALAMPGVAMAADSSPHTFTGNVGFTTDYTFRGISQNYRSPTVQGGFDYAHSSGVYLGTWASNVSGTQYGNTSMEWDWYGGYNGKVNDDLAYNVGLVSVVYPGGKTSFTEPTKKFDTTELQFGGTYAGVNVAYHLALTDWFGISQGGGGFAPGMWAAGDTAASGPTGGSTADATGDLSSKGSGYLEVNYSYALPEDISLALHAGNQKLKNFSKLNYTDYKIGVSKAYAGFNFGLAYTKTNAKDNNLYHVYGPTGDNKELGVGIVALSVSRSL